jgi:hypothetical protein
MIFSFASQDTIEGVMLKKAIDDHEHLISFMRKVLRDLELNYSITQK